MKKIYMLLAAVLLMVMIGCGGGGDSSSAPSSAKAITAFSLNGIDGTINEAASPKTISVTMPPDTTDLTALVATFTTTGANVKVGATDQTSGTTPNDFTNPVVYTVTADDAKIQNYTVTVTVSSSFSGFLDKDFGTVGKVTTPVGSSDDYALALGIQSDGKIVVAGYSYNVSTKKYDFALTRYNIDGSLDDGTSNDSTPADQFGTGGKVTTPVGSGNSAAYALSIQSSDDKILVAGFAYNGGNYDFALVKYNSDGSLATGFGAGGKVITDFGSVADDAAYALGIQSDGKIVIAGTSYNGKNNDFALARYNTNGSLDIGFGTGGKVITDFGSAANDYDDVAYALGIQSDGYIVAAGTSNVSGNNDFALVRYNPVGSLDTTFDTDGKVTTAVGSGLDTARALAIQPNGQIVAAGTSNNGSKNNFALVRYNKTDGSLDSSFDTDGKVTTPVGSLDSAATALAVHDGKIVVAGISYDAVNSDFVLVRYNLDGSLDTGFYIGGIVTTSIGSGLDVAGALGIQSSDGKIVVSGYSYNVSTTSYDFALVRYWP